MAEITTPLVRAATLISSAPGSPEGALAIVQGDGTVAALIQWDPVQGDTSYHAPAGSFSGGGSRRHLFDRPVAVTGTVSATVAGLFPAVQLATGGAYGTQGSLFIGTAEGLAVQGKTGGTNDFTLYTPTGGLYILTVPTGTFNVRIYNGSLTVAAGVIVTTGGVSVISGLSTFAELQATVVNTMTNQLTLGSGAAASTILTLSNTDAIYLIVSRVLGQNVAHSHKCYVACLGNGTAIMFGAASAGGSLAVTLSGQNVQVAHTVGASAVVQTSAVRLLK